MEDMTTNPMPEGLGDAPHRSSGRPLKTLLLIIVALLIVWGLYAIFSNGGGLSGGEQKYTVESAQPGEVVVEFPEEFLPSEDVVIAGSYVLKYNENGGTLPTLEYTTTREMEDVIATFATVLNDGGWNVTKEASVQEVPVTNFYAIKGTSDVNITLSVVESGVRVHIAYIDRE